MSTHQCLAGKDCRAPRYIGDERQPATTEQPDTLCPVCEKAITSAIKQLPRDWADLHAAIGDRDRSDGPKISSTPAPVIPINIRRESLMSAIVDAVDRAAAVVSDALGAEQPTGHRKPPERAEIGSLAFRAAQNRHPRDAAALKAGIAITEPHINLLAAAGPQPVMIWVGPRRCRYHRGTIRAAEQILDIVKKSGATTTTAEHDVRRAYTDAGQCDNCNGWGAHGQQREITEHTGTHIALHLADLHHQTRAELGKTRLRHRYAMPCPRCGGRVGRDDGETVITCDDQNDCKSSWTDREYKYLTGLVIYERQDVEIAKYLLAEAYWRLDQVQQRITIARDSGDILALPGSGEIIADAINDVLDGHKPPADRAIASAKTVAEQRQDDDDAWEWGDRPQPYKPPKPKRKRHRATRAKGPIKPVHPSSRSTLIDIDESVDTITGLVCPECHLVHVGECA